jgi:hypothetical protein
MVYRKYEVKMDLYIKNKQNKFIPIGIDSVMSKDLNNKLVIVKVGSDTEQASLEDLDATASSFSQADVLDDINNVSIIITPYQIEIDVVDQREVENKNICIQIKSGDDIGLLDDALRSLYRKIKNKHSNVTILPTPLKVKDYRQVKETLKRCKMRKKRRSRV